MLFIGCSIALPIVAHVFAPVYHGLKLSSVYEVGICTLYHICIRVCVGLQCTCTCTYVCMHGIHVDCTGQRDRAVGSEIVLRVETTLVGILGSC